jgi:23S rRNA (guanosine2251-2'-O)-methyltransferase
MSNKRQIIVIADKIRSLYNVGSIFRTCDGIGAEKLYLIGYTATPETKPIQVHKTALGADETVDWEHAKTIGPVIKKLKKDGFEIIALEEKEGTSLNYRNWKPKDKVAIILGNEVTGVSTQLLKKCDKIIHLPMEGKKKSLNVSVAFGAIGYYVLSKSK